MRSKLLIVLVPLLAALVASQSRACSQCMCGAPFPADALGGVQPSQLRFGLEDRYLSKSNALDEAPGTEQEREHRISGYALWRASDRVALLARLPYNVKRITAAPLGEAASTETSKGLGDAELSGLIGLARSSGTHAAVLGMVLGVAAPTGSSNAKDPLGQRLDAHLQPSTGAWSGTAGVNIGAALVRGMVDGSVLVRANGTNSHGYRYGNAVLFNVGYTSPATHDVRLLAQVNGRSASRDRLEDGTMGENTGGTVVYLSPGVRWQTGLGVDFEGGVQIPVVESLLGVQDEHTTGHIALSVSR